jgi:tetratricopeptide (TPR) repeat protein
VADDNAMFQNSQRRIAEVASHVLAGRIAEASGDRGAAIAEYETAVKLEDALNYNEPADWFYPVRETLGAALLRDGRAADAANVFAEDLRRNPHNPRSLFGLATARNDARIAAEYRRRWKGSPLTLADF